MLKKLFYLSPLSFVLIVLLCPAVNTSCTKTNADTVTVTKTDTLKVAEKDTLITTAILTANSWKAIYDRASVGGDSLFYVRGGTGNTIDLDNEYETFNANGTGIYTDNNGNQTTFTWTWSDSTYTRLSWVWNLETPITVRWENLYYDDAAIHYTEYYIQNGNYVLSTEVRVPR
jgi:hypothetical protein